MEKAITAFIVLAAVFILIAIARKKFKKGSCDDCPGCCQHTEGSCENDRKQ